MIILSTITMPAIQYEGRTYVLETIKLKCLTCNTFCQTSQPAPNHADCECGQVKVDGGISAGATVYGHPWEYEDYSIYRAENRPRTELSQYVVTEKHFQCRKVMIESYKRYGVPLDEIMLGR